MRVAEVNSSRGGAVARDLRFSGNGTDLGWKVRPYRVTGGTGTCRWAEV